MCDACILSTVPRRRPIRANRRVKSTRCGRKEGSACRSSDRPHSINMRRAGLDRSRLKRFQLCLLERDLGEAAELAAVQLLHAESPQQFHGANADLEMLPDLALVEGVRHAGELQL